MIRRVQPVEGLVFAIDFRLGDKDAWIYVGGNLAGTFAGSAAVTDGKLRCTASGDYLQFTPVAGFIPGVQGCIFVEAQFDSLTQTHDNYEFDLQGTGDQNNIALIRFSGGGGALCTARMTQSTGLPEITLLGPGANSTAKHTCALSYSGMDGSAGTADLYMHHNGVMVNSLTGQTITRDDNETTGTFSVGGSTAANTEMEVQSSASPCSTSRTRSVWT